MANIVSAPRSVTDLTDIFGDVTDSIFEPICTQDEINYISQKVSIQPTKQSVKTCN